MGWVSFVAIGHAQYWTAAPAPVVQSAAAYQSAGIVAAPNGKLFVSGVLRRLNADGSVDASFEPPADGGYQVLLAFPDNRALVRHAVSADPDDPVAEQRVIRLAASGSIDGSFAPARADGPVTAAHLLPDGRVLLVGRFRSVNGAQRVRLCVLNADGTVSTKFQSPFAATGLATSAAPLPDGKIIVGGDFTGLGPHALNYFARLNADGSADPTLSAVGVPLIYAVDEVFAWDEKFLIAYGPYVFRANADGSRDVNFSAEIMPSPRPTYGPLQSDGRLLYLIEPTGGATRELRRLNLDGSRDDGFVIAAPKEALHAPTRPVLGSDGSLFVSSALTAARQAAGIRISRVRTDGTIDESYRPHLTAPIDITAFARAADGTFFVVGDVHTTDAELVTRDLVRLRADGSADLSFAPDVSPYEFPEHIWVQPGGKPLVELFQLGFPGNWFAGLVRLNADGSRDPTFQKLERYPAQLAFDGTGRIYAAEATGSAFNVVRYSVDGVLDSTFAAVPATSSIFAVWPDGSVAVTAARFPGETGAGTLKRYFGDGSADAGFSVGSSVPDRLFALAPLPDGRLLAIGSSSRSAGNTLAYYRYAASGAVDFLYFGQVLGVAPSPFGSSQALEIAGVVYDVLLASGAPAALHQPIAIHADSAALELDVATDGKLVTSLNGFSVFNKISQHPPTFDSAPAPTITGAGTGVLNVGGEMVLYVSSSGALPQTVQWYKEGVPVSGATAFHLPLSASPAGTGTYTVRATNAYGSATSAPVVVTYNSTPAAPAVTVIDYDDLSPTRVPSDQPLGELILTTGIRSFVATATGNPVPTVHWEHNGRPVPAPVVNYIVPPLEDYDLGPTSRKRDISIEAVPASTGLYAIVASNDSGTFTSSPMLVGLASTAKVVGEATEVGPDTPHPSGRRIDQLLLRGTAATFTADSGQVSRLSFIDLNNDIVQVEVSGAGSVSLILTMSDPSGPQPPINYVQPGVSYMRGHAAIVVTGADETTNLSVFSVGRANAYNQALFRSDIAYDGIADIAYVAILSRNGKFGSLRCANVSFFETRGLTGVYAPGVRFTGPVYLGNVESHGAAPVILLGGADADTLICGGDLDQPSGRPVQVSGLTHLRFADGTTSHGLLLPAQRNKGRLVQDGSDVTDQIVLNP